MKQSADQLTSGTILPDGLIERLQQHQDINAAYLYGSRAKGEARQDSDWDLAVVYRDYEPDLLERALRPQHLEAELERLYPNLDIRVVDIRQVPVPLQWNIIQGIKLYDRGGGTTYRLEHAIISAWEKDYER